MQKIKIIVLLVACAYLLAVTFIIGLGRETTHTIIKLQNFSADLYGHPFLVSNTTLETRLLLKDLYIKNLIMVENNQNHSLDTTQLEIENLIKIINNNMTIIGSAYLGDKNIIADTKKHLEEWHSIIHKSLDLARKGNYDQARLILSPQNEAFFSHFQDDLIYITNFARTKAKNYLTNLQKSSNEREKSIWTILSALIVIISVITFLILWHIRNGFKLAEDAAKDISEREQKYRAIIETSSEGFWMTDKYGNILEVNDAYANLSGYSQDELMKMRITDLESHENQEDTADHIQKIIATGHDKFETVHRRKDGSTWPVEININFWQELGGVLFVFCSDITAKKHSEEVIWQQANFDHLTQLPNRCMMQDYLDRELKNANRLKKAIAILLIDLDHFKEVNDSLGHHQGDTLLLDAANRIQSCVRESNMVARLGGDEFVVILNNLPLNGQIERVTNEIITQLSKPFTLDKDNVFISASIGITYYPNDAKSASDLLKNADQAMYVAKKEGRNCFSYYTPELEQRSQKRLRLITDMHKAIETEQFIAYFQPIIDLNTGHIHKAEALIRWQLPDNGLISPLDFIPVAEDTGMINEIGEWIFMESIRWAQHWRNTLKDNFQVSVNLSPVQILSGNDIINNHWLKEMASLELNGDSVVLEITEGLLLQEDNTIIKRLASYRRAGMQIAIDDFGTGYSALSYLNKFDVDYLKLDKSFVNNIETLPNERLLAEAIINMAHTLNIKVIAEGVETAGQLELLTEMGCDFGQGYLFAKPMPGEELGDILQTNFIFAPQALKK